MIRSFALSLALGVTSSPVVATTTELICENWRREYLVTADVYARTVILSDTKYSVLAIERRKNETVVVGTTVNDGPTFKLTLGDHPKMEFFSDSKLFQVDICRKPVGD